MSTVGRIEDARLIFAGGKLSADDGVEDAHGLTSFTHTAQLQTT